MVGWLEIPFNGNFHGQGLPTIFHNHATSRFCLLLGTLRNLIGISVSSDTVFVVARLFSAQFSTLSYLLPQN